MIAKDIAKFISGFAANQVLVHGALALSGVEFVLFGINYDHWLNTTAVVFWASSLPCWSTTPGSGDETFVRGCSLRSRWACLLQP